MAYCAGACQSDFVLSDAILLFAASADAYPTSAPITLAVYRVISAALNHFPVELVRAIVLSGCTDSMLTRPLLSAEFAGNEAVLAAGCGVLRKMACCGDGLVTRTMNAAHLPATLNHAKRVCEEAGFHAAAADAGEALAALAPEA